MIPKVLAMPMSVILTHKWSPKGKVLILKARIREVEFALVVAITPPASTANIAKKATIVPWTLVR